MVPWNAGNLAHHPAIDIKNVPLLAPVFDFKGFSHVPGPKWQSSCNVKQIKGDFMARGSKAKYSSKQKRQAKHTEDSEKKEGRGSKTAARIAWATVNKETGGARKSAKGSRSHHGQA
jgi:hypothetical protein